MSDGECLVFEIENNGKLCSNAKEIAINFLKLYKKNESIKNKVDNFLDLFNKDKKQKITIIDIINVQKGEEKDLKKVALIKEFLDAFLNDFNIGFSINNEEFVGIEGALNSTKDSILKITAKEENLDNIFEFIKAIRIFLLEIKNNVENVLNTNLFKQALYDLLSGLCRIGQKEFLLKICDKIKGSEKYNDNVIQRNGLVKSENSILTSYISGLDNELGRELYLILYLMLGNKSKSKKLKGEHLKLLIEKLVEDKEFLDGIINTDTWDFLYEVNDPKEIRKKQINTENTVKKEVKLSPSQEMINHIYDLSLNDQVDFFINFHELLLNNSKYDAITKFGNGNLRKMHRALFLFTKNADNKIYQKLFDKKGTKVGKNIIKKFISRVTIEKDLYEMISNFFGIDKSVLIQEGVKTNESNKVFGNYEEFERQNKQSKITETDNLEITEQIPEIIPELTPKPISELIPESKIEKVIIEYIKPEDIDDKIDDLVMDENKILIVKPNSEPEYKIITLKPKSKPKLKDDFLLDEELSDEGLSGEEYDELAKIQNTEGFGWRTNISIDIFLPILQEEINKGLLKKYQNITEEILKNHEVDAMHFVSFFQHSGNGNIGTELFNKMSILVKKSERWKNIFSIMPIDILNDFLLNYISMESVKK